MRLRDVCLRVLPPILLVAALIWFSAPLRDPEALRTSLVRLREMGPWGPVLYSFFFVLGTVCFLPLLVLTLSSGFLFGPLWGTFATSLGSLLSASLAFLGARYWFSDAARRAISKAPRMGQLEKSLDLNAPRWVVLLRMAPIFPFNLLNAAFGLTRVKYRDFAIYTVLGMLPGLAVNAYLGSLGQIAIGASGMPEGPALVAALLATAATIAVTIYAGFELRKVLGSPVHGPKNLEVPRV